MSFEQSGGYVQSITDEAENTLRHIQVKIGAIMDGITV